MIDRNLSYSQLRSWQACRRQWGYKYRDGYKPKQPSLGFMRGSLLHLGMESGVQDRMGAAGILLPWWPRAEYRWKQEWCPEGDDGLVIEPGFFEGCRQIVEGALEVFFQHWQPVTDERGPMIERRMYADLPAWYRGVVFIPDVVAVKLQDPYKGGVFGVDYKSFTKPKLEMAGEVDLQSMIYQRGLRGKGYPAMGSCLFELAVELRKPIRLKKDGQPYAGDQERHDNWSPVTGQIVTYRSLDTLNNVWEQVVLPLAKEMHDAELDGGDAVLVPHLDYYGCQYCEFFEPCQARFKGHDEASLLADKFTRREPRQKGA